MAEDSGQDDVDGAFTSCVGTRWYKGSRVFLWATKYGLAIGLWSALLLSFLGWSPFSLERHMLIRSAKYLMLWGFDGRSMAWISKQLPDFKTISFSTVENPTGIAACLPDLSPNEISNVKKLIGYNPEIRASAIVLLLDKYLDEEPLPCHISELRVPSESIDGDEDYARWGDYGGVDSDSDFEESGQVASPFAFPEVN